MNNAESNNPKNVNENKSSPAEANVGGITFKNNHDKHNTVHYAYCLKALEHIIV